MINVLFDLVLWINREERVDRRRHMEGQFQRDRIRARRVVGEEARAHWYADTRHGKDLLRRQRQSACALSHRAALQMFLREYPTAQKVLILEDDAIWEDDLCEELNRCDKALAAVSQNYDYDLLYLMGLQSDSEEISIRMPGTNGRVCEARGVNSAVAVAYSRRAAEFVIQHITWHCEPYDLFLKRKMQGNTQWRCMGLLRTNDILRAGGSWGLVEHRTHLLGSDVTWLK